MPILPGDERRSNASAHVGGRAMVPGYSEENICRGMNGLKRDFLLAENAQLI